jgi:hypothetical protein
MMSVERNLFMTQFPIVKSFIYHLVYYRTLSGIYHKHELKSEFWTLTIDAHLLRAVTAWCMVFGSDTSEPTHWKNLSTSEHDVLQSHFRSGLYPATGLTKETWSKYWKSVVSFRNKYAVHRDLVFEDPVPVLDTALSVVYYYDGWVREIIYPDSLDEPPLKLSFKDLNDSMGPVLEKLLVG